MEGKEPVIVVLISGDGSNLQALIDAIARDEIPGSIQAVISNKKDVRGLQRAETALIQTHVVDHQQYKTREAFEAELIRLIDQHHPDLIVLAGFMRILSADFIRHYEEHILNIHPSLLPKYQGLKTHQRVLDAGEPEHGVTVHFVTSELDSGPNIIQAKVQVLKKDSAETLAKRVQQQEHIIYPIAVKWFIEGRLSMTARSVLLDDKLLPESGLTLDNLQTIH